MNYLHRSGRSSQFGGSVVLSWPLSSSPPPHAASSATNTSTGTKDSFMPPTVEHASAFSYPKWWGPVALTCSVMSPAATFAQDSWTSPDKALHFSGSAVIGGIAAHRLEPMRAFGYCAGFGVAKEVATWAFQPANKPSGKDMVWNAIGCAAGVGLTRWSLARQGDRTEVRRSWEF